MMIIHVDMDAFYASVEMRDNPSLRGKPLIIGAMPNERGVVATCSYEARKYGVHSAMNIKEAHRRCPMGIYMHPDFDKYKSVSVQLHEIWNGYAEASEYIALDEAYLDVTHTAKTFERACEIGQKIKQRTLDELGLSCSVGVAYSKSAAKIASEEKKPNGYFVIPDKESFVKLMINRDVRTLYTVGSKTAEKLHASGIHTVRDIQEKQDMVVHLLGKQGQWLVQLSFGIDNRKVEPYLPQNMKSLSRELTFQEDVENEVLLKDVLFLLCLCVEDRAKRYGLYGRGVTLKITFSDMKNITRSKVVVPCHSAMEIYQEAATLLDAVKRRPIRLIGVGMNHLSTESDYQLKFDDFLSDTKMMREKALEEQLDEMHSRYGLDFAGHLSKIFRWDTLHKTAEYMRKHIIRL